MDQNLAKIIQTLKTKPPNIPYTLFEKIQDTASDFGDEYPLFADKIETEIVKGTKDILRHDIPSWVYTLSARDWEEFFVELSKIPHRGTYMVWLFQQMKARLK